MPEIITWKGNVLYGVPFDDCVPTGLRNITIGTGKIIDAELQVRIRTTEGDYLLRNVDNCMQTVLEKVNPQKLDAKTKDIKIEINIRAGGVGN